MPFDYVLANLIAENEGAVGALFLDATGETVGISCSAIEPQRMRLLGAYVGIYLRQVQRFLDPETAGEIRMLHIENQDLHVLASPLAEGYFLVLAQRNPALVLAANRSLVRAGELLLRELFGTGPDA